MTNSAGQEPGGLRFWRSWLCLGAGLVALVVFLSLTNLSQMPTTTLGDKVDHLLAYGVLMGWFGQLFIGWRSRFIVAAALVALGVAMEFLQGLTGYRYFEWLDACANVLGVLLGFGALALGADKILCRFERLVLRNNV